MRAAAFSLSALLALASAGAQAQLFETERMLTKPVEPGVVAPHKPAAAHAGDVGETGSLHVAAAPGSTLQDWYAKQGRPAVALFFDRRLERLPAGWDGTARVMIASEKNAGGKTETENISIALEQKAPRGSLQQRRPVVQLVENSLLRELQRMRVRLVDPSVVERALAAKGKGGDTEYDGLKGAAGYLLEIELAATGAEVSMIGGLKSLTGEIVATVRAPVQDDLRDPAAADALARDFIRKLLAAPAAM